MSDPVDVEDLRRQYLDELDRLAEQGGGAGLDEPGGIESRSLDPDAFAGTVRAQLDVLSDERAPSDERVAALRGLAAAAFQPREFAPFHAEFVETLRSVAEGTDAAVRRAALDQLTLLGDPEADRILRDTLTRSRGLAVPRAEAVRLLARTDHGDAAPLFRDLARTGHGRVRDEAVRALASDPQSEDLLAEITADTAEPTALRRSAAMSLKALSPERFAVVARMVVLDDADDDGLRATALSAIAHADAVTAAVGGAASLADELGAVETATTSRALKTEVRRFRRDHGDDG